MNPGSAHLRCAGDFTAALALGTDICTLCTTQCQQMVPEIPWLGFKAIVCHKPQYFLCMYKVFCFSRNMI